MSKDMELQELGNSYIQFLSSPAWRDLLDEFETRAEQAENKALILQPGAGELTRLESLLEWRMMRLARVMMLERAQECINIMQQNQKETNGDPISDE